MEIVFNKSFVKSYRGLSPTDKRRTDSALDLFSEDPFHRDLKHHLLKARMKGFRSISAGFDLRMIFTMDEHDNPTVHLIKVGSHNQVY